jgi:nucleoid DNA-binding protein
MNKKELVKKVVVHLDKMYTQKEVTEVLNATFKTIIEQVASGDKVNLVNFGSFYSKNRSEKVGTDPRTHERIVIPEKVTPKFNPSGLFSESVNA